MKQYKFIMVFLIDIIFIFLIPVLSKIFTSSGSALDYIIPYFASFISFLTIGILVGILCIKKMCQK